MDSKNRIPAWQTDWVGVHPDPEKVICRDCVYRLRDSETRKEIVLKHPHLSRFCSGICEKYPDDKPDEILFDNAPCPHYKKET